MQHLGKLKHEKFPLAVAEDKRFLSLKPSILRPHSTGYDASNSKLALIGDSCALAEDKAFNESSLIAVAAAPYLIIRKIIWSNEEDLEFKKEEFEEHTNKDININHLKNAHLGDKEKMPHINYLKALK